MRFVAFLFGFGLAPEPFFLFFFDKPVSKAVTQAEHAKTLALIFPK